VDCLKQKYQGGLRVFLEKHGAWCNRRIVVLFAMANFYLDEAIQDLEESGLIHGKDYLYFEPTTYAMFLKQGAEIDLKVSWLKGYVKDHGMMVYYVD